MLTFRSCFYLRRFLLSAARAISQNHPTQDWEHNSGIGAEKSTSTKTISWRITPLQTTAKQSTSAEAQQLSKTMINIIEQFKAQKQLANTNFTELKNRIGRLRFQDKCCRAVLKKDQLCDSQLRTYISKTIRLAVLNDRVDNRQKLAVDAIWYDFLSKRPSSAIVISSKHSIVGRVRGESELFV